MKETVMMTALLALCVCAGAQTEERHERLDSVVVSASRAGASTPVTYSSVGKDGLQNANPMNSLPMTLNLLPSVVTYNEGGTGLGNSAMTIRGSKGSQVNVTLNGITLNDAESQEVFWVNIPALTGILSSVQVQRGLGTSASGAGAFGASINMNTAFVGPEPSFRWDVSAGSYDTFVTTVSAQSGLLPSGLYFNLAWSAAGTDGYIRNGKVGAKSLFAVAGWLEGRHSLRLTYLMGDQRSGITWDGIEPDVYAVDRRYNGAGRYIDDDGNVQYYPGQTDNYAQHHLQLNYTRAFSDRLTWTGTFNYTRGDGYDEYYKVGRKFAEFGFPAASMTGLDGKDYNRSDMIYRKAMGNDLSVFLSEVRYRSDGIDLTGGLNLSRYLGGHWGEILWTKVLGEEYDYAALNDSDAWYRNKGKKDEAGAFIRAECHPVPGLTAYADLQYRHIGYSLVGADDKVSSIPMDYHQKWDFFNPHLGLTVTSGAHKVYGSVSLGHREPGRSDIKENIKGEMIPVKPESMVDVELGSQWSGAHLTGAVNLYLMEYHDMLLETGRLSSSGYAIKENIPRGWRRGIELSAAWSPAAWFRADGNLTLSTNKIKDYTAYVEDWVEGGYREEHYGRTTMLLSPSTVGMLQVSFTPFAATSLPLKTTTLSLDGKWVGRQYWDNTEEDSRCIPSYFISNLSLRHTFDIQGYQLGLAFYVGNLLDRDYYAYAWVYRAWQGPVDADGRPQDPMYREAGIYPQAPRNYMVKLTFGF